MPQLMALGDRYPELLSALLPALGFAHQPAAKCVVNVVGSEQLYVHFADEATPHALAASCGLERSNAGVARFWATKVPRPHPRVPDDDLVGGEPSAVGAIGAVGGAVGGMLLRQPGGSGRNAGTNYTSCVVPFSGDLVAFLVTLERLNGRSTRAGLYDNTLTIAIVEAFWLSGTGLVHACLFLAYVLLLVLVIVHALAPAAVPSLVLIPIGGPFMLMEAYAAVTSETLRDYLGSAFNWVDVGSYALLFAVGVPGSVAGEERRCVLATLIVLMGFKVLFFFRAYTTLVRYVPWPCAPTAPIAYPDHARVP
jgi:hypothetical protein